MNHNISITIPQRVVEKIDEDRGDISRSRYILRLLENAYDNLGEKKLHLHSIPTVSNDLQQNALTKFSDHVRKTK